MRGNGFSPFFLHQRQYSASLVSTVKDESDNAKKPTRRCRIRMMPMILSEFTKASKKGRRS
jgi:hypothetical protein